MYEGRVEVWYNHQWGTICDSNWDILDATVVCQQLGYGQAVRPEKAAEFGPGTGPIILTDVDCEGHEDDIFDCARSPRLGNTKCQHRQDAGVVCQGECPCKLIGIVWGRSQIREPEPELVVCGIVSHGGAKWDIIQVFADCTLWK